MLAGWGEFAFVDVVAEALNLDRLRIVETGGDAYTSECQQWDGGNNIVASRSSAPSSDGVVAGGAA